MTQPLTQKLTLKLGLIGLIFLLALNASACQDQAQGELENILCELKAKGQGSSLPSLYDFRKNSEKIQRLLLKKPAKKAGIPLPVATQPTGAPTAAPRSTVNTPSQTKPPTSTPTTRQENTNSHDLSHCQLQYLAIDCRNTRYLLQTNKPNTELARNALTPANQLVMRPRHHPAYQSVSDLYYLSKTYPLYIEKMLAIGLGDSTMSFTRFAATYEDVTRQGEDFAQRFSKMYELLKIEKANNAIQRRYDNSQPSNLSQCMNASRTILVCDNIERNWVYLRVH